MKKEYCIPPKQNAAFVCAMESVLDLYLRAYNPKEPELWDACEAIIKELEAKRKPRAKKTVYLLSGLLFCECGQKMYVPSNTPKYVCKKCRSKIPIDDLETIFIEQLKSYMLSPTELNSYLEAKDSDLQDKQAYTA